MQNVMDTTNPTATIKCWVELYTDSMYSWALHCLPLILFCFFFQPAFAQQQPILDRFSVEENDGRVFLNWTLSSGSTCNGIQIYRSADTTNFIRIGIIPGVCGSPSDAVSYQFIDTTPFINRLNYYRLEFGGFGFSDIISIELIDLSGGGFQIRPNPMSTSAILYFDNAKKQDHLLTVYNLQGMTVLTATTMEGSFRLDPSVLPSGLYIFTISLPGYLPALQGKFIVQH